MDERNPAIGFIGVGILGKGLALALASRGYRVAAAHSRSKSSAEWLAGRLPGCRVFDTAQELSDAAGLVFITTPDSSIGQVATDVTWRPGQWVVHCSGVASTEVLGPASRQGSLTGALHPLQTFAGLNEPEEAAARLSGVTFAVSGEGSLAGFLQEMASELGGRHVSISDADRPLYHAAAVLACPLLAAVMQAAVDIWQAMGFSAEQAVESLYPLTKGTVENVARQGVAASLTGPTVRGDVSTIRGHLEALYQRLPHVVPLYGALIRASLPLVAQRGVGPGQLLAMQELIDHYSGAE
ncbi:MAG: DUF2520 domain-containing protein [Dehalococcoidia bacterium]|nr:DUF2520 domain-containing protein [Dehalococcoidia bacterium]